MKLSPPSLQLEQTDIAGVSALVQQAIHSSPGDMSEGFIKVGMMRELELLANRAFMLGIRYAKMSCVAAASPPVHVDGESKPGKYGDLHNVKLRPGEPFFLLRGQDLLAPYGIQGYAEALRPLDSVAALECEQAANAMCRWQGDNTAIVKFPD